MTLKEGKQWTLNNGKNILIVTEHAPNGSVRPRGHTRWIGDHPHAASAGGHRHRVCGGALQLMQTVSAHLQLLTARRAHRCL